MINMNKTLEIEKKIETVLCEKLFSNRVKSHIKKTLLFMSMLDEPDMDVRILEILEGLKKTNVFQVGTNTELSKSKEFRGHINLETGGCISVSREKVAVVKNQWYLFSLVHELLHLSQPQNAYFLRDEYDFSKMIQLAMIEGESCYYESLFVKKFAPNLLDLKGGYLSLSYQPSLYNMFLEFYQDIRNLLEPQLLNQWKHSTIDYDIMPELELYMKEHYQNGFCEIYQSWVKLLYQYHIITGEGNQIVLEKQMIQHNINQRSIYDAKNKFRFKINEDYDEKDLSKIEWFQQFQIFSLFIHTSIDDLRSFKNHIVDELRRKREEIDLYNVQEKKT